MRRRGDEDEDEDEDDHGKPGAGAWTLLRYGPAAA